MGYRSIHGCRVQVATLSLALALGTGAAAAQHAAMPPTPARPEAVDASGVTPRIVRDAARPAAEMPGSGREWRKKAPELLGLAGVGLVGVATFLAGRGGDRGAAPPAGLEPDRPVVGLGRLERLLAWITAAALLVLVATALPLHGEEPWLLPWLGQPAADILATAAAFVHGTAAFVLVLGTCLILALRALGGFRPAWADEPDGCQVQGSRGGVGRRAGRACRGLLAIGGAGLVATGIACATADPLGVASMAPALGMAHAAFATILVTALLAWSWCERAMLWRAVRATLPGRVQRARVATRQARWIHEQVALVLRAGRDGPRVAARCTP